MLIQHIDVLLKLFKGFLLVEQGEYLMLRAHKQQSVEIIRKVVKLIKDKLNPES